MVVDHDVIQLRKISLIGNNWYLAFILSRSDNCPLDKCRPGQLPPRIIAPEENTPRTTAPRIVAPWMTAAGKLPKR